MFKWRVLLHAAVAAAMCLVLVLALGACHASSAAAASAEPRAPSAAAPPDPAALDRDSDSDSDSVWTERIVLTRGVLHPVPRTYTPPQPEPIVAAEIDDTHEANEPHAHKQADTDTQTISDAVPLSSSKPVRSTVATPPPPSEGASKGTVEQSLSAHPHHPHADPLVEQLTAEIKRLHHRLHERDMSPFEQDTFRALDQLIVRAKAHKEGMPRVQIQVRRIGNLTDQWSDAAAALPEALVQASFELLKLLSASASASLRLSPPSLHPGLEEIAQLLQPAAMSHARSDEWQQRPLRSAAPQQRDRSDTAASAAAAAPSTADSVLRRSRFAPRSPSVRSAELRGAGAWSDDESADASAAAARTPCPKRQQQQRRHQRDHDAERWQQQEPGEAHTDERPSAMARLLQQTGERVHRGAESLKFAAVSGWRSLQNKVFPLRREADADDM